MLRRLIERAGSERAFLGAPAPVRPIVAIQSDDWGRVGIPSLAALERLKARYPQLGKSPWDYYGLETEQDLISLSNVLEFLRDRDGRPACVTANFIMANADLAQMRLSGFSEFSSIPIDSGFPEPWKDDLLPIYRHNIERGVFYPGLHGFTHFNISGLLEALAENSMRGELARDLAKEGVPYCASITPEFNFALVSRGDGERFVGEQEQAKWIDAGVETFTRAFGRPPRTTCAPGYRANATTFRLWAGRGLEAVQVVGRGSIDQSQGLLIFARNVNFEPALRGWEVVNDAAAQAEAAVARGLPIIICSHSVNYMSRYLERADLGRDALRTLGEMLLEKFPDLRFVSDSELIDAYREKASGWFRSPTGSEVKQRIRHVVHHGVGRMREKLA